jgi:hypothetical protein
VLMAPEAQHSCACEHLCATGRLRERLMQPVVPGVQAEADG